MKIGIIGSGNVGGTLGRALANAGHHILYGTRTPQEPPRAELQHAHAEIRSLRAAVTESDVVLLTTPWNAVEEALSAAGDFGGKVLLDATNPIGPGFALTHGHNDSGAEQVARWAQNARVVKVFNSTGRENMENPLYGDRHAAMFVCGDDADACTIAVTLAKDIGFDALTIAGLRAARLLEPLALLWITLSIKQGRDFAFGILRRG